MGIHILLCHFTPTPNTYPSSSSVLVNTATTRRTVAMSCLDSLLKSSKLSAATSTVNGTVATTHPGHSLQIWDRHHLLGAGAFGQVHKEAE